MATLVEGDLKAPCSLATTQPTCRRKSKEVGIQYLWQEAMGKSMLLVREKFSKKNLLSLLQSVRQWSGRLGFNPRSSRAKDFKKWCLISPSLTLRIIRYVSRVKWSNPKKGVVAIEKGAFGSPSTTVANFTFLFFTSCFILDVKTAI